MRGFLSKAFGKCSQIPRPLTHVPEQLCHLCGRYVPRRLDDAQIIAVTEAPASGARRV